MSKAAWIVVGILAALVILATAGIIALNIITPEPAPVLSDEQFAQLYTDVQQKSIEVAQDAMVVDERAQALEEARLNELAAKNGEIARLEEELRVAQENLATSQAELATSQSNLETAGTAVAAPPSNTASSDDDNENGNGDSATSQPSTTTETADDLPIGNGVLYVIDFSLRLGIDGKACAQLVSGLDRQGTIGGHAGPEGTENPFGETVDVFFTKTDSELVSFAEEFEYIYIVDDELDKYETFFDSLNPTAMYSNCGDMLLALGLQE